MGTPDDDEAWRAIVENYGQRPRLADDEEPRDEPIADRPEDAPGHAATSAWPESVYLFEPDDRFVPPDPPPIPLPRPARLSAWAGALGAPLLLLVWVLFSLPLPAWFGWLLGGWFLGGLGYLVWSMPTGPSDPGDDGARI